MKDLHITRRQILKGAAAAGALGALAGPTSVLAEEEERERRIRWDIVSIDFTTGCVNPGGRITATLNSSTQVNI